MKYLMMIVGKRDQFADPPDEVEAWKEFLHQSRNTGKLQGRIEGCPEGLWLLPIDSDFQGFSTLVHLAEQYRVSYKILLIDGELLSLHESEKAS